MAKKYETGDVDFSNIGLESGRFSDISKASPRGGAFRQIGTTGLQIYDGFVQQDFLPDLKHQHNAYRIYREMSDNDPTIGAMLYVIEQLIQNVSMEIMPADTSSEAKETAEFVESCLHDMEHPWPHVLSEILTMLPFGFAWMEVVLKKRDGFSRNPKTDSQHNDGKFGWRKIALRSQESTWRWIVSEEGDIMALQQQPAPSYETITIPFNKSLLFRYKPTLNNPEGRSILRNAFRPWFFKKRFEEIEGIAVERELTGLPVLIPGEGIDLWNPNDQNATTLRQRAEDLVRNIRADQHQGVVIPNGWELQLLSATGSRLINTTEIIQRLDQRIAVTVLADMLLIGQDRVGSFALVSAKQRLFSAALSGIAQSIADTFNRHAIPRLLRANGMSTENPPFMSFGPVEDVDFKSLAEYINKLVASNALTPDEPLEGYLRQVANFPKEDPESARATLPRTQGEGSEGLPELEPRPGAGEEEPVPSADEIFGPGESGGE